MEVLIAKQSQKDKEAENGYKKLEFTSFGLKPNVETTTSQTINTTGFQKDSWVSKIDVNGDLTLESSYGQLEFFIENGGFKKKEEPLSPSQNKSEYIADNQFDKYLTCILEDNENASCDIFKGLLINTLKLETSLASYVNLNVGFVGQDSEVKNSASGKSNAITTFEGDPLICLGAEITENENEKNTSKIESLSIDINNSLQGKGALNSVYNKTIKRTGLRNVNINFTYNEFDKEGYTNAFKSLKENSTYKVKVEFKEVKKSNEKGHKITLEFPKCKVSNIERTNITADMGMSKSIQALYDEKIKSPVIITFEKPSK
ncbi:phage tail tube protein [Caviibacter abscessus]|uniref:phage tail tube protein n=1 Tax=Caviibacter abscessus TaxID=1766719 RepID=UPI000839608A|nr:phage tail tube protein [Caviibacter abscessus]